MPNFKRTQNACYLAMVSQAFIINVTAILFVGLKDLYNLSYSQLGLLVFINFGVQVVVDAVCGAPVDKFGFRPFMLAMPVLIVAGVILFVLSPYIFPNVYVGFVISTVLFACAGGLMEVIVSPIIDNLPLPDKEKQMTKAHSFYGWGQVSVVAITSLLIYLMGADKWQIIMSIWLVVPIAVFIMFLKAPVVNVSEKAVKAKFKEYGFSAVFVFGVIAIIMGGAVEAIMAQWSSTFMQESLKVPKLVGDLLAVATFAGALSLGRTLHGKKGGKINISKLMMAGSLLAFVCYLIIGLTNIKWLTIVSCGVCGFAVSLLWPGTLTATSKAFPAAGTILFALLACAGDIGSAVGGWVVGVIADNAVGWGWAIDWAAKQGITVGQLSLKLSILFASSLALLCFLAHLVFYLTTKKNNKPSSDKQEEKTTAKDATTLAVEAKDGCEVIEDEWMGKTENNKTIKVSQIEQI